MVEDGAVERLGRRCEPPSHAQIALAWPSVAARVVVGKDDSGATLNGGVGDDVPQRKRRSRLVALVARQVHAARLIIDMGDPQAFATGIGIGEATRKECARGGKAVQLQRKFGTLISHKPRLKEIVPANDRN